MTYTIPHDLIVLPRSQWLPHSVPSAIPSRLFLLFNGHEYHKFSKSFLPKQIKGYKKVGNTFVPFVPFIIASTVPSKQQSLKNKLCEESLWCIFWSVILGV